MEMLAHLAKLKGDMVVPTLLHHVPLLTHLLNPLLVICMCKKACQTKKRSDLHEARAVNTIPLDYIAMA